MERYLDSNLAPSHAESHNFIFYKLELGVIANKLRKRLRVRVRLEVVLVLVLVVDANILYYRIPNRLDI